jgi:hypothetical protein
MSDFISHNLDELKPQLAGFGVHVAKLPPATKAARIQELGRILIDARSELDQLLSED